MIKNILQQRWILILLGFTVFGLLVSFILRLITPKQIAVPKTEFITTDDSGQSVAFNGITFSGTQPQVPVTLPLATIQPSQTTLDYVKGQLIETYGLQQAIGLEGLWRGETHVLSYDSISDEFLFYATFVPEDSRLEEPNRAIESAQTFIQATFPNLALAPFREGIIYFNGLAELEETTVSQAGAAEIPFTYTVENIPIYLGHERTVPIAVIMNNQYEAQKVVFQPNFVNFVPSQQRATVISINSALQNINDKNEGVVVSAFESETGFFTLKEAVSGKLTAVKLEYRADFNQGIAYPFYRFVGELTNQDGQTIQAEIIAPAIETK